MGASRNTSLERLQIAGRFESLRKILLSEAYVNCRDKPLADWALPTDRRLPLALLGRTVGDLLSRPFSELEETPGIGYKKLQSLLRLLARVANTDPWRLPVEATACSQAKESGEPSANGFDPDTVSEVVWERWRASVVRHGLQAETLGRLAPSLKHMTRVIWNRPLGDYIDLPLAGIRALKTHGEKRVRAILEVFYCVHCLVDGMQPQEHLAVRLIPRRIDAVEQWVGRGLQTPGVPKAEEIRQRFVEPLVDQIRVDATQQIVSLAENRLGVEGPITSVRRCARQLGLTRARVYQLLNEINDIMNVRWPNGRQQVYRLLEKFEGEAAATGRSDQLVQLRAAVELFYPRHRRGADGPMERAGKEDRAAGSENGHGEPQRPQMAGQR